MAKIDIDTDFMDTMFMDTIRTAKADDTFDIGIIQGIMSSYFALDMIPTKTFMGLSPTALTKGEY